MENCLFCKIIKKEIKSYTIYEDEICLAFLDINPKSNGHTLIIPKKHTKDLEDIDIETINHIFKVAKELSTILKEKLKYVGLQLVQNNGICQEIKHFHLHLIPIYNNDKKYPVEEIYNTIKN